MSWRGPRRCSPRPARATAPCWCSRVRRARARRACCARSPRAPSATRSPSRRAAAASSSAASRSACCARRSSRWSPGARSLLAGAAAPARAAIGAGAEGRPVDPHATLNGLFWLLAALAQRNPLVLALDDLHWADEPSLRFLAFALGRVESLPVLIAATARPAADPLASAVAAGATTLRLRALSEHAVRALVAERLGAPARRRLRRAPAWRRAAATRSSSSSSFRRWPDSGVAPIEQNARRVGEVSPENVARSVSARLQGLGDGATRVARALAALGDGCTLALAAEVAELPEPETGAHADALATAGLLAGDRPLRFAHPLLRTAVEAAIAPGRAPPAPSHRGVAAGGRRCAGRADRAAPARDRAGRQRADRAHARRGGARRHRPRRAGDRRRGCWRARWRSRRPRPSGPRCASRSATRWSTRDCPVPASTCASPRRRPRTRSSPRARRMRWAARRVRRATSSSSSCRCMRRRRGPPRRTTASWRSPSRRGAWRRSCSPGTRPASTRRRSASATCRATRPRECALLAVLARKVMTGGGTAAEVAALVERAARHLDLSRPGAHSIWLITTVLWLPASDVYGAVERALGDALEQSIDRGSALGFAWMSSLRAMMRNAARRPARGGGRRARRARVGRRRGPVPLPAADAADRRARRPGQGARGRGPARGARAGRAAASRPALHRPLERTGPDARGQRAIARRPRRPRGGARPSAALRQRRHRRPRRPPRARDACSTRWARRTPPARWPTTRSPPPPPGAPSGRSAARCGSRASSVPTSSCCARRPTSSARRPRGCGRRARTWTSARPCAAPTTAVRAGPRSGAGSSSLRPAAPRRSRRSPAASWPRAAGACRRAKGGGLAELTPSELRVGELAASGLSNPEIAQRLFITIKTVEMHLSNGYRKLDVRGRSELPAALAAVPR